MAQWRYKNLGQFPPDFHLAMLAGPGDDKVLGRYMTQGGATRAQVEWRIFRHSIRHTPSSHQLFEAERACYHRTRIDWNDQEKRWELLLTSKPSALSDLENPEVLSK